jgi:antitoxin component HigA of HigAB toxin-antitoxin module
MSRNLDGISITRFHDQVLRGEEPSDDGNTETGSVWRWVETNHRYNRLLWDEEDKARRTDVGAAEIATSKRLIDQYNQKRNDAIEALDEAILSALEDVPRDADARLNSETAGAMIDRLSILALKILHMREQTERGDASPDHIQTCRTKLERLTLQRRDLASCLDNLLREAAQGRAYFKVYRQFKMYNDPTLNPYLYAQRRPMEAGKGAS